MMAATLNRDGDTAFGVTDAPHLPAAARNVRGPWRASTRQRPLCEVRMGSLNVGTTEGKALEVVEMMKRRKMEVLYVHRRRSGKETGHGRWRRATRCCTQEETVGVTVLVSS